MDHKTFKFLLILTIQIDVGRRSNINYFIFFPFKSILGKMRANIDVDIKLNLTPLGSSSNSGTWDAAHFVPDN